MTTKELAVRTTPIPGLLVLDLPVHGDARGWFKENWQREKMLALGLPDLGPVQNNISFNQEVGVTRGIHAEPWDKYISVATGRVFGAWVDLREGPSFGTVYTHEIDPSTAIFVPRGVGNSFQTIEAPAAYTYLVNAHWSADAQAQYTFLNLADPTVAINWPIPLDEAERSDKDLAHPMLEDVTPMPAKPVLLVGSGGQLGRAVLARAEAGGGRFAGREVVGIDRDELDLTDPASVDAFDFSRFGVIVNASAYTAVDLAETSQGRADAWAVNVTGLARLVDKARDFGAQFVHVSSDYVFDGTREVHTEEEGLSPLGVYAQTKAASDVIVSSLPRHFVVRTSWVIGDGKNFVRTMADLAARGIDPTVVGDQIGRLTFTDDLAAGIEHLLSCGAAPGVYNLSNEGPSQSWADIAADVYELTGHDRSRVTPVTTSEYFAGKEGIAPRPEFSTLDLSKLAATGFVPRPAADALKEYLSAQ
ncbi:sugar nucleotide-binding protein [Devriesea agamarum]|uniref:sugar nucleotide-binding protein n=1 Tax=Devriesea agamarum TaxID=472569 RepID=UPI00071DF95F|nr:sugar nucleotide-binding protein [Devriesea agamarum]